jgi:acyl-coenzyme A synthetase/AMP-(fatty) acid ligase
MFYACPLLDPLMKRADAIVLVHPDGRKLTCADVLSKSKRLAASLYQRGFCENDVVVLTLPAGEYFLYIMYAMLMLRAKVVLIDPEMGRANFASKLQQLQPKWAFVDSRILILNEHPLLRTLVFKLSKNTPYFKASPNCQVISVGKSMPTFRRYLTLKSLLHHPAVDLVLTKNDAPHELLLVYTSGTIEEPRGVVHTIDSLTRSIQHLVEIVGYERNDLIGTDLPHYMLLGISAGIAVILTPAGMTPAARLKWIEKNGVSILFSPPSEMLSLVVTCENEQRRLPPSVRKILLGSAPVHKRFLKRLLKVAADRTCVSALYGMTELLICAHIDSHVKVNYPESGDVLGMPWEDVKCKIAADGEILLSSPQLYARYFHETDRDEYHATGDTGYIDGDGYLILTGRK